MIAIECDGEPQMSHEYVRKIRPRLKVGCELDHHGTFRSSSACGRSSTSTRMHSLRVHHLKHEQVPIHKTLMTEGRSGIGMVILVECAAGFEVGP